MSSLIQRLSSLVRADVHGVVDALEDRRLVLRQSLREAELELDRKRARITALEAEDRSLCSDEERLDATLASLEEDVDLALAGDKEKLARFTLRKLIPLRNERARLAERLGSAREERARLADCLASQEAEFEDLKVRVKLGLVRSSETEARAVRTPTVADEEIELELLRRRGLKDVKKRGAK